MSGMSRRKSGASRWMIVKEEEWRVVQILRSDALLQKAPVHKHITYGWITVGNARQMFLARRKMKRRKANAHRMVGSVRMEIVVLVGIARLGILVLGHKNKHAVLLIRQIPDRVPEPVPR